MRRTPIGGECGLYVDLLRQVHVGDEIRTPSGRRYGVIKARVQERGKHRGRQHLRCIVLGPEADEAIVVHEIVWYAR